MESSTLLAFQTQILTWYTLNKRDLPWRKTRDPYAILVSEVMSQQTQIARVIPKYLSWVTKFPTVFDLAKADTKDVLAAWSGLGYNRRAMYLRTCAQIIVSKYQGKFPQDEKLLRLLPGVGEYTARAILCFAFNSQVAVIDTNVKKVILVRIVKNTTLEKKELEKIAQNLLPNGQAYEWNQALMDYAASELKKEKISIPRQTAFKYSNRYFRGRIIKYLLSHAKVSEKNFLELFSGTLTKQKLTIILESLIKDKLLIKIAKKYYTLT